MSEQIIDDWVPFHRRLARGAKKALPRGVRFVLLELSLEARSTGGILNLPLPWTTDRAIHDLIGGSRKEIREALEEFVKADEDGVAPIEIVKTDSIHTLKVTKWSVWAGHGATKSSTPRVRLHRERKKNQQLAEDETLHSNAGTVLQDKTRQDITGSPLAPNGGDEDEDDSIPESFGSDEPEPEPTYNLAWRLWRELYQASRRRYGRYVDNGIRDERVIQIIAHRADEMCERRRDRVELLLRHWFVSFLRDDGDLGCIARARHSLRLLERKLSEYGEPKTRPVVAVRASTPPEPPPPLPSKERLAELRALAAGALKTMSTPKGAIA